MSLTLSVNKHIVDRRGSNHAVAVNGRPQSACFVYSDHGIVWAFKRERRVRSRLWGHLDFKRHFILSIDDMFRCLRCITATWRDGYLDLCTSCHLSSGARYRNGRCAGCNTSNVTVSVYGGYGVFFDHSGNSLILYRLWQFLVGELLRGLIPSRHLSVLPCLTAIMAGRVTSEILRHRQLSKAPMSQELFQIRFASSSWQFLYRKHINRLQQHSVPCTADGSRAALRQCIDTISQCHFALCTEHPAFSQAAPSLPFVPE